jgi:integrase
MITLKLVLDKRRAKTNGAFPLIFRINGSGITRDIPTGFSALETDWDEATNKIRKSFPNYAVVAPRIKELEVIYLGKIIEYERTHRGEINVQELKEYILSKRKEIVTVKGLWIKNIENLQYIGRHGGARVYKQALSVLEKVKNLDIPFEKVDYAFLKEIENIMLGKGIKRNTTGVYFRAFRAIYNQAINEKLIDYSLYPFRAFKIKRDATVPRPISKEEMKRYFHWDVDPKSPLYESWLIGKLIFLLAGINVADLFQLTDENLRAGRVIYFRSKTKRMYSVKVLPQAQEIFAYFKGKGAKTLIGELSEEQLANKPRIPYSIHQRIKKLNKNLEKIGISIGLKEKLTTYTFRYTIANLCKREGYDVQLISELLGHSYGNRITGIYLEGYDLELIDSMNEEICNMVNDGD